MICYRRTRLTKYRLEDAYTVAMSFMPCNMLVDTFDQISLNESGILHIKRGYAWDGASGPSIDTRSIMRAALIHDALYNLIKDNALSSEFRKAADDEFRTICLNDGVNPIRAWYSWLAVRLFGKFVLRFAIRRGCIITAP